ncbi:aminotransferase class IV family protein [Pseudaminobacter sp. 19-2017]|uniref:Probable branched-chain-amino-acid aminotransferase n=1 Tax=Pseudaminobacter soli (ex Zhang et al. 2022) TaxID=2831468 RepID=A0A942E3H1_9HYPH|nr:aminotransferase class IV family protein [Pseudaminobacter soli]MBS3650395.1 aminotransferase class IV family protein [Pseudaminobacter soli]
MSSQGSLRDGDGPGFGLIETMRWEPEQGFIRLPRHLGRLAQSAAELGLRCDLAKVERELAKVSGALPLRVRLVLSPDGLPSVTTQPFQPLPEGVVWRLGIANARLNSADPLLRHKTTRRDTYQQARSEFTPAEADEVILLNERDEVCEGTITNVFVDPGDGGPLLTPALSCGLLAGVLRGELLDESAAREATLFLADLEGAKAIFVGNSLRGLIPAELAPH